MLALLSNWKLMLGIGFTIGLLFSYQMHNILAKWETIKHNNELAALETNLNNKCAKDQKLAQEVSNEYQLKLSSTTTKLNNALRQLRSGVKPDPTNDNTISGYNATSGNGRLYYADPTGAVPSLERAGIATKQAEQLIACQKFISEERNLKYNQ